MLGPQSGRGTALLGSSRLAHEETAVVSLTMCQQPSESRANRIDHEEGRGPPWAEAGRCLGQRKMTAARLKCRKEA